MTRTLLLALLACALAAPGARARPRRAPGGADQGSGAGPDELVPPRVPPPATMTKPPQKEETPWILRWMIKPLKRGMWIRLPIMDTDPNRGITAGIMPIWVIQGPPGDDRIHEIHAPSLTYNNVFGPVPTYRYYWYPQEDAALLLRGSAAKYETELMGQYEDGSFRGSDLDVTLRVQHNVDAGQRFFGFGPDSDKDAEGNYKQVQFQTRFGAGYPVLPGSKWRVRVVNHFEASKFNDGPIPGLRSFTDLYPAQASEGRQQTDEWRLGLDYDSRDHGVTTERGNYLQLFGEKAVRGVASMYEYNRWGVDARTFIPWETKPGRVFSLQARLDQLTGPTPPFWLQSRLGGKYSLRAYGEGRYVDRGAAVVNAEQRFRLYEAKMAGVTTEFQLAPFVGAGTVFDSPEKMHRQFVRPVVGGAVRAVAKPQVVGSIDFGAGREGLSVFMDINYSF